MRSDPVLSSAVLVATWRQFERMGTRAAHDLYWIEMECQLARYWRVNPITGPEVEREAWRKRHTDEA